MNKILKIQSIADIITNSSTEVFVIIDSSVVDKIKNLIKVFLGDDAIDRFNVDLDYSEMFLDLYDDIIEIIEEKVKEFDEDIVLSDYDPDDYSLSKKLANYYFNNKTDQSFDERLTKALDSIELKDLIEEMENLSEGSDYPSYPTLIVEAKDKTNKKDVEISKILQNLPYFCDTEARYC